MSKLSPLGKDGSVKGTIYSTVPSETGTRVTSEPLEGVHPLPVDKETFERAVKEIAETRRFITDPKTRMRFLIAEANRDAHGENAPTTLEVGAFFASLFQRDTIDKMAQRSAVDPTHRVGVTLPGNGGSSPLLRKDRKYLRRTGRFTHNNGKPLESFASLNRALKFKGINVTHISGDSSGGGATKAAAAALPPGQLKALYASEASGSNKISWMRLVVGILLKEGGVDAWRAGRASRDPNKPTLERRKILGELLRKNTPDTPVSQRNTRSPSWRSRAATLFAFASAAREGPDGKQRDPLVHDLAELLTNNPDAQFTHHFAKSSILHTNNLPEQAKRLLLATQKRAAVLRKQRGMPQGEAEQHNSRVVVARGHHAYNTYYPGARNAVEQNAFTRRALAR